jgi:PilZ domain-containing protein
MRAKSGPAINAQLRDISGSGASIVGKWCLLAGEELELDLPNGAGSVSGQVVRCTGGILAWVFRQGPVTLDRVNTAIESIVRGVGACADGPSDARVKMSAIM